MTTRVAGRCESHQVSEHYRESTDGYPRCMYVCIGNPQIKEKQRKDAMVFKRGSIGECCDNTLGGGRWRGKRGAGLAHLRRI